MIQILLACALASLQEPGQDAKQAVDALLALKEDDEEGRMSGTSWGKRGRVR